MHPESQRYNAWHLYVNPVMTFVLTVIVVYVIIFKMITVVMIYGIPVLFVPRKSLVQSSIGMRGVIRIG